jgi:two-component system sensor histidine kinase/response regulator
MSNGQESTGDSGVRKEWRILIVDDDPILQTLLSAVLERAGYRTKVVEDGAAAIAAAADADLIFIDLHMPGMGGIEAARRIRATEAAERHVAIIAMSASTAAAELDRCLAAGIDEFLPKPFDLQVLLASVERSRASFGGRRGAE